MTYSLISCDRDQQMLLPPSLKDWLAEDHLARFVVDAVEMLDLSDFYEDRREDGCGRPAYDPKVMLALLIYAYASGVRSSRAIERRCRDDIAFRFITANNFPDHATIARFVVRYEEELAAVFDQTLRLAAAVGLIKVGIVALDSTRVEANASLQANRSKDSIGEEVAAIIAEARATDQQEDRLYGERRGDELPDDLARSSSRLNRLKEAKERLDAEHAALQDGYERTRARHEELREQGMKPRGKPLKPPEERVEVTRRSQRANVTDPDSRIMSSAKGGSLQAYNAQAVATEGQIVIACGVTNEANDYHQFEPMIRQAQANLEAAGIATKVEVAVADAGYDTNDNLALEDNLKTELLIASKKRRDHVRDRHALGRPRGRIPKDATARQRMERKLRTKRGEHLYRKRASSIEPVFGQQRQRGLRRFRRRGLAACDFEWHFEQAVHNLLKLRASGKLRSTPITRRTSRALIASLPWGSCNRLRS